MKQLITTTEAGQRLGLTREQVLRLIARCRIRAQYLAGRWLVDGQSVDAYAAERGHPQAISPDELRS
jgi:excisionase family DNA binding protein